jgi:diketogulonate reductase-like aldo/keto reductase
MCDFFFVRERDRDRARDPDYYMKSTYPEVLIANHISLPVVGLGTWLLKGSVCTHVVQTALNLGYRHFDTAHIYENHKDIGRAIRGFERKQLFLTSKFTLEQWLHEGAEPLCDRALRELECDYLDLYLLHFPDRSFDMVKAMQQSMKLIEKQKIRALGVSNFTQRHLQDLLSQGISVSVNQVEFHPYLNQKNLLSFCQRHQIHVMAYRTLGKGALISDPIFEHIGKKYHKTPAQILLRWVIEHNVSVIPKTTSRKHLQENLALFDFSLTPKDRATLDHLQAERRFCAGEWTDFNYV